MKGDAQWSSQIMEENSRLNGQLTHYKKKCFDQQAEIDELNNRIEEANRIHNDMFKKTGGVLARTELCKIIDGQRAEIYERDALINAKWISVKDHPPRLFEIVIVCQPNAVFTGQMLADDYWESFNGLLIQTPDYWMPLPEAKTTGEIK